MNKRLITEIVPVGNGHYTLNFGNYNLDADFFKIERLAEGSNYYLLWSDAQMNEFYLYNAQKQTYAFDQKFFKKIEYYSEDSLSFVAYRNDHNYAYIFYEDGYIDKEHVCEYIGEEYNGVRPIKTCGGKWLYYDVYKRKTVWKVECGYKLKEGWTLGRKFNYNCFTVNRADGGMCIWRYNEKAHKIEYHSSTYDSIKTCVGFPYLICKKFKENIFELFLCKKFRSLIAPQLRTSNFLFKGNYIFYSPSLEMPANGSTEWQIFNGKDGSPALLDWKNIRLYDWDSDFYMLVDTDTEKDKKVFLSDIEKSVNDLKALSKSLYAQSIQEKTADVHNEEETSPTNIDEPYAKIKEEKHQTQLSQNKKRAFQCKNQLPSSINYCTSIDTPEKITSDGNLQCNRKCTDVLNKKYICWIAPQSSSLIVTEYRYKTHKVVFYKTYEQTHFFEGIKLPTRIVPITLEDVQEETLVEQLEEALGITTDIKYDKVRTGTVLQEKSNSVTESPEISDKQMQLSLNDKVCFTFNNKCYALNIGDIWDIDNVFDKQKYLLKEEVLAILLTSSNLVSIEYKQSITPHYRIIGVGKDVRFDQDFGPINKTIRDNAKKILLFKKDNEKTYLMDEVCCCGYTIETQTFHRKKKERKVIQFDLASLRQVNEWYFKK